MIIKTIRPALLTILLLSACDSRLPPAHITPGVRFNHAGVEMGTPVEVTYSFRTSQDFPGLKKDLIVFVHFLDPAGAIRFVDDHTPPLLTNQWGPGHEFSYTRTVFVPESIPAGEYVLELGMYTPSGKGERFALNARRLSERSYDVGRLTIREQQPETLGEYASGWYDVEREPGNPWEHWRWTSGSALLRVRNPAADSILYLKADADRGRFPEPQNVRILLGEREVDRFAMTGSEPMIRKYSVDRAELGPSPFVDLRLEVDRTFRPSSAGGSDPRDLGIRVYSFYLGKATD